LRLRTVRADIDARLLEAKRGRDLAISGLRALIGPGAPADLDVDADALAAVAVPARDLAQYEDEAQRSRPEVKALTYMVAAKRALADLETKKQYPDLFLLGTATYAYASSVDTPHNAFASDPFHVAGGALAAGFRWPLDLGVRNAHAIRVRAEAEEAEQHRREAMTGIAFDVEKAATELKEADGRMTATKVGEKAGRQWVAAVAQNLAVGLAEARDFSDALLAFFQARIRLMQSIYDYNIAAAQLTRATGIDVTAARL
jgi:outer membrane protein TolC